MPAKSHGKTGIPEYRTWAHMIGRCGNIKDKSYPDYGARGIKVCDRWRNSFEAFYADMGPRPDGYSIERIDVNGDYCPENCKWIPKLDQNKNKRNSKTYLYEGEQLTLAQIVGRTGLPKTSVFRWLNAGAPLTKKPCGRYEKFQKG